MKEGKEHGKKNYLVLCNGEWLKVIWILMLLLVVCSIENVIKKRENNSY
jgi:hypothetical protein